MDCVVSLFSWHNETLNIWSHLVATGYCLLLCWDVQYPEPAVASWLSQLHWFDHWLLFIVVVVATLTFLFSTVFHLFCCMSRQLHDRLLTLDLLGVFLLILAFFYSGLYFGFYLHPQECLAYMAVVALLACFVVAVVVVPAWRASRPLRVFAFALFAGFGFVPMFHWMALRPTEEIVRFLPQLLQMYGFAIVGLLFYLSHFPEKYFPHYPALAFYCNSHTIWHLLVTLSAISMHSLVLDFISYLPFLLQRETLQ